MALWPRLVALSQGQTGFGLRNIELHGAGQGGASEQVGVQGEQQKRGKAGKNGGIGGPRH